MGCLLTSLYVILFTAFAVGDTRLDNLQYVGCFELSFSLSKNYHEHMPIISMEGCLNTCTSLGTPRYIGIESSDNFCYCGGDIAENSIKRDDSLCNIVCSDLSNRTCGGDWLMSLYDTQPKNTPDRNDSVSFLVGLSTGIRVYNSTSLPDFETVLKTTNNDWSYTVDYHYSRKLVFTNTKGKLVMVGVLPSFGPVNTTPIFVRVLSQCDGFAVDWVADKIYWADCTSRTTPRIMKMDLDGNNNDLVAPLGGVPRGIKRMEVDPYSGMLFWLADGVIETLNLTTKEYRSNVSGPGIIVRALALDRTTQKVYYVGAMDQTTPLFSMDYTGSNHLKIFSIDLMKSVFGLGIHGGFIYWVNYAMSTDIIYKASLDMRGGRSVKMLQTVEKAVWHMRVIHPDIQNTPGGNPCAQKGCSQFCKVISPTSAVCQCSSDFYLHGDGVSCIPLLVSAVPGVNFITPSPPPPTTVPPVPSGPIRYGNVTYLGCFGTSYAISNGHHYRTRFITLDKCISQCRILIFRYAGIGARDMNCYCGNGLATESSKVADTLCSDSCPDNPGPGLKCGGDYLMSLYDIQNVLPGGEDTATNEDNVKFIVGHSNAVRLYNSTDLDKPQELMRTGSGEWAYSVDYHYGKNLMFTCTRKSLFKTSLFPSDSGFSSPVEVTKWHGRYCEGFAVDWVFDRIFYAACFEGVTINVIDLDGRNRNPLLRDWDGGVIKRMEVDPYRGSLFWIKNDVIESCETTGQGFRTNLSSPELTVRGLTLDIVNQRVFYFGSKESEAKLFSMDYDGNDIKTHFHSPDIFSVYGLGVLRGAIYWINYRTVDVLFKARLDLNSGGIQQMKVFNSDNTVWHMKVVDEELQTPPKKSLCSPDGSSCLANRLETGTDTAGKVLLVTFVVVGVVVIVGLLMFLTDMKYLDLVRAKLSRVPYSRESGRDADVTTYDIQEDSVNLI